MFTRIIRGAWRERLPQGIRQWGPWGWMVGEDPAQRGASLRWWQWGERIWKLSRGRAGGGRYRWWRKWEPALFEGKGLLGMGEVGWKRERHPGHCSFHCNWHRLFSYLLWKQQAAKFKKKRERKLTSDMSWKFSSSNLLRHQDFFLKLYFASALSLIFVMRSNILNILLNKL